MPEDDAWRRSSRARNLEGIAGRGTTRVKPVEAALGQRGLLHVELPADRLGVRPRHPAGIRREPLVPRRPQVLAVRVEQVLATDMAGRVEERHPSPTETASRLVRSRQAASRSPAKTRARSSGPGSDAASRRMSSSDRRSARSSSGGMSTSLAVVPDTRSSAARSSAAEAGDDPSDRAPARTSSATNASR